MRTLLIAVLALGAAVPVVAQQPLVYQLNNGQRFALVLEARLDLPILGDVDAVVRADTTVTSSGAGWILAQRVTRTAKERGTAVMNARFTLTPDGRMTVVSALPQDAEKAFLAQGALLLLPAMPSRPPAAGLEWSVERTMMLPKIKPLTLPPSVKIRTTYKLDRLITTGGRTLAVLGWSSIEAPGEGVKVGLRGAWEVDVATGLPVSGPVNGRITIPVRVLPDMVMKVDGRARIEPAVPAHAAASGLRGTATGRAASLLGVR